MTNDDFNFEDFGGFDGDAGEEIIYEDDEGNLYGSDGVTPLTDEEYADFSEHDWEGASDDQDDPAQYEWSEQDQAHYDAEVAAAAASDPDLGEAYARFPEQWDAFYVMADGDIDQAAAGFKQFYAGIRDQLRDPQPEQPQDLDSAIGSWLDEERAKREAPTTL